MILWLKTPPPTPRTTKRPGRTPLKPNIEILVVADDPLALPDTVSPLKEAGYSVIEAQTGRQALHRARSDRPELILLDIVLPDLPAFEVCRTLKSDKTTSHIFVCMVSEKKIASADQPGGFEIGADDYFTRPIENRELLARVKTMLRLIETERKLRVYQEHFEKVVEKKTAALQQEIAECKAIDEKLKESEQTARALLNATTESAFLIELDGTFVAANQVAAKRLGKTVDDLIGRVSYDMIPNRVAESRRQKTELVIRHGKPIRFTDERDGMIFDHNVCPIFDDQGNVSRLAIFASDITDQKNTERSLRESQKRYLSVINTMLDGVAIANNQGRILFVNPAFCATYQYSQEESIGMPAVKLIHPDYHHVFEQFLNDLSSQGHFLGRTVDVRKDGSTFPTDVVGSKIHYDGQDCFLAVIRDITEHRKLEKAISKAAEEWRATFDATNNVIWVLDEQNRIIRSNIIAETVFQMPIDAIIGKHCWEIVHGKQEPIPDCPVRRAKASLKRASTEIEINDSWYEITIDPIIEDGRYKKAIHIIVDITERKRAEIILKEREQLYGALFENNRSVMLLIDPQTLAIVDANPSACAYYGYSKETITRLKISDINMLSERDVQQEVLKAETEQRNYFNFRHRLADGRVNDVEVYSGPIDVGGKSLLCSIIHDISKRKEAEREREKLICKLQKALNEIKTLKGIVPICSHCKKIRDDKGYWNQIEAYIQAHSEAEFSHSICEECARKYYPELNIFDD